MRVHIKCVSAKCSPSYYIYFTDLIIVAMTVKVKKEFINNPDLQLKLWRKRSRINNSLAKNEECEEILCRKKAVLDSSGICLAR